VNYFEQFAGDDPLEYGTPEVRLVHVTSGQYVLYDGENIYKDLKALYEKIGSPHLTLHDLRSDTALEYWVNGAMVKTVDQG
jgi:hypothetical protein